MITSTLEKQFNDTDQSEMHPIFKKRIILYPPSKYTFMGTQNEEYKSLLIKNRKYEDEAEANELLNEVHDFEKRNFGKAKKVTHFELKPLESHQRDALSSLTITEVNKIAPGTLRSESSMSSNSLSTYIKSAPTWCNVDDLLQIRARVPMKGKKHAHKFTTPMHTNNERGIRIVQKDLLKFRKSKDRQFYDLYRQRLSQDNMKKEMIIRKQIYDDREAYRAKQQQRIDECASMGQEWAIKMKAGPAPEPEVIKPPTPTEIDAIRQFDSRNKVRMEEEKLKRHMEDSSIPRSTSLASGNDI